MNALLIIDPQNSFCNPGDADGKNRGSLYVNGAEQDMKRLSLWIKTNSKRIDYVGVTIDSHQPNDIAHPNFWKDKNGTFPSPFTVISSKDIESGKWTPQFEPERCLKYLRNLEQQGEYPHIIWPIHCVIGSEGAAIYQPLMEAIIEWTTGGRFFDVIEKGVFPFSEHFGAFQAQIPDANFPETKLNQPLIEKLSKYKNIYLAGEAKSHCVASSIKQALNAMPELASKFIVLEDCMSNVTGFETIANQIYESAKKLGVSFARSKDSVL